MIVGSTEMALAVEHARQHGGVISDSVAQTIASQWQSPSPRDRAMVTLSTRGPAALSDAALSDLHGIIANCIAMADNDKDRHALVALSHWVLRRQGH